MNKKYNEFTAGSYGTTKIFLIADPTTGQLEKMPLSEIPAGSPVIKTFTNIESNTTAGWSDHYSYDIPANKFASDGDFVEIEYYGISAAPGEDKRFSNVFANTGNSVPYFSSSSNWFVKSKYIRTNASRVDYTCEMKIGNNVSEMIVYWITSVNFSQPITAYLELYGNSIGIMKVNFAIIKFYEGNN